DVGGGDERVLLALDGGDYVGHVRGAVAVERLEESGFAHDVLVPRRQVPVRGGGEVLVVDPDDPAAHGAQVPPAVCALGAGRRGQVGGAAVLGAAVQPER